MSRNYNPNEVAEALRLIQQIATLRQDQETIEFALDIENQRDENLRLFNIHNQAFILDYLVLGIYFSAIFLNPFEEKSTLWGIFHLVVVLGVWGCTATAFSDQLGVANHSRENFLMPYIDSMANASTAALPHINPTEIVEARPIDTSLATATPLNASENENEDLRDTLHDARNILTLNMEQKRLEQQGALLYTAQSLVQRPFQGVYGITKVGMWTFKKACDMTTQCYQGLKQKMS